VARHSKVICEHVARQNKHQNKNEQFKYDVKSLCWLEILQQHKKESNGAGVQHVWTRYKLVHCFFYCRWECFLLEFTLQFSYFYIIIIPVCLWARVLFPKNKPIYENIKVY
jgi:hypothetical protein